MKIVWLDCFENYLMHMQRLAKGQKEKIPIKDTSSFFSLLTNFSSKRSEYNSIYH
jgi:hypothetical protein